MILFKFAYIRCKPWLMDKRRRREDPTSPNRDSIETLGMWEKRHLLCGLYAEKTNDVLSPSIEFVHYSRVYDRSAIEPDRLPQSRAITNRGTGQQVAGWVGKYGCGCGSVTLDGDGTRPENKLILLTSQPRHFLRQVEGPGVWSRPDAPMLRSSVGQRWVAPTFAPSV